ncbi:hypothetical protein V500_03686, partial [Pseudogymnoascus sp. VKM F-4518 (FW-2643)]
AGQQSRGILGDPGHLSVELVAEGRNESHGSLSGSSSWAAIADFGQ